MSARTITGTIKAQLSSSYGPEDLRRDDVSALHALSFSDHDMSEYGYSVVGTAEITVALFSEDEMVATKVESLRAEAVKVQADAYAKVTHIERQIQQLLAITNEVKA